MAGTQRVESVQQCGVRLCDGLCPGLAGLLPAPASLLR